MNPEVAARLLSEELYEALAPSDASAKAYALTVRPPADLAPDTSFRIHASLGSHALETDLPTGLAIAYLADEEAAVDEWKQWVAGLRQRLLSIGNSAIRD
ncbi:MAG: hypothetical protein PVJ64_07135 [Gemmatimonadales bacterium]|jgi:hypothetical protein